MKLNSAPNEEMKSGCFYERLNSIGQDVSKSQKNTWLQRPIITYLTL